MLSVYISISLIRFPGIFSDERRRSLSVADDKETRSGDYQIPGKPGLNSRGRHFARPGGRLLLLVLLAFVAVTTAGQAQLKAPKMIAREESSTTFPYEEYRERSAQRLTYNHVSPFLTTEFDFRHVDFKYVLGGALQENRLLHAGLKGQNLGNDLIAKAGRIWGGNDSFRAVDGISLHHPFGNRLSATALLGKTPVLGRDMDSPKPAITEGRLDYRFNRKAFLALQASQDLADHYSSAVLGYAIEALTALGEFKTTGATDTYRLGFQYFDGTRLDLSSDYRVQMYDGLDTGIFRNTVALSVGSCYFETGLGRKFQFGDRPFDNTSFYEGTVYWGNSRLGQDNLSLGYLLEIMPEVESRTMSGEAERVVTKNTRIALSLADTRFNDGRSSVQSLGGRLHRKVYWGFYELDFALVSGGDRSDLRQDLNVRAGYEY
jgi:hypothetical protein